VHTTWGRALAIAAATLSLAGPAMAKAASPTRYTAPGTPAIRHVVLAGIGGLRWSDVSATGTPALWRLAGTGSVGSLIVSGIHPFTCPADGWLTLNGAARATIPHPPAGPCPAMPAVTARQPQPIPGRPAPALVATMPALVRDNAKYHYDPQWGLLGAAPDGPHASASAVLPTAPDGLQASASAVLPAAPGGPHASAPGPGHCATAAGPGAALALASPAGRVASYLPSPSALTRAILARCPLTVADLGSLPPAPGPAGQRARAAVLRSADRRLARIIAGLPGDCALVVFAPGDGFHPHLRVLVVSGPHFAAGLLTSASTRQPGMALLIDLTPTVLNWLGTPVPAAVDGAPLAVKARPGLPATLGVLAGQDAAAQVYRQTVTPFYQAVGFGYPLLFALIWVVPWGRGASRRPRRRVAARTAGVWAASVPAGTFLASLVPWWAMPHPALVLYAVAVAGAAVVAAAALSGPWRRDPLGPPGVVAAVTLGVIGLDLMTGSQLAQETPFGLSVLEAGRFYGLGNNGLVIYGASGVLCAAWLGGIALRQGRPRRALLVMTGVTLFTVIAAGWPGFGAKVGGTIAMVPGFLVLLAAAAQVRVTARRALLAAVSGVALVIGFALINYLVPVTGHSDIGGFVGKAVHGGAAAVLQRKISSNLGSLTANPFIPVIPVVVIAAGLMLLRPARLRCTLLVRAYERIPLLRAALSAIWLIAVLGWFAEDSGVTVPAAGLPMALPLMIVILSSVPGAISGLPGPVDLAAASSHPELPAGEPSAQAGGRATAGPGSPVIVRSASAVAPDRAGWRIE
jgi:hypothetical protein